MKEAVFDFGEQKSLSGVATLPVSSGANPERAVIILNSGLIHRVGPSRLYVKMARMFAENGQLSFRFDFSGIGDSLPRRDNLPFQQSSVLEVQAAMNFLESKYAVRSFILTGICAGADVSFEAARQDKRITAIMPIDFFNIPSKSYFLQRYKQRMMRLESWRRLLSGKSDLWSRVKKTPESELIRQEKAEMTAMAFENFLDENSILKDMETLLLRNVKCCFLYSSESAGYFNYQQLFRQKFEKSPLFSAICIHDSDHGFTLARSQQKLLNAVHEAMSGF